MANVCSGFIEPLNLECLLVNMFAGSMEVFIFVAILAIASIAVYFRMIPSTMFIIFIIFAIIIGQFATGIYFLLLLLAGLFIMAGIKRLRQN